MAKRNDRRSIPKVDYDLKDDQGRVVHKFRIPAGLTKSDEQMAMVKQLLEYTKPIAAKKRKELEAY